MHTRPNLFVFQIPATFNSCTWAQSPTIGDSTEEQRGKFQRTLSLSIDVARSVLAGHRRTIDEASEPDLVPHLSCMAMFMCLASIARFKNIIATLWHDGFSNAAVFRVNDMGQYRGALPGTGFSHDAVIGQPLLNTDATAFIDDRGQLS